MQHPSISIIDQAINFIETGRNLYSCVALRDALYKRFDSAGGYERQRLIYWEQYEAHVRKQYKGRLPCWWNSNEPYKKQRIKALRGFKQACIEAGEKLNAK